MKLTHQLLAVVDAFRAHDHRSDSRLSGIIFGDGSRIARLREGKDMLSASLERAMQWFSNNWPEGADWPSSVARPAPAPSGETLTAEA